MIFKDFFIKKLQCLIALTSISLVFDSICYAQLLDYQPFAGYGLGKGIRGNDYGQPLPSCITGTVTTLPASNSDIHASIVYNQDEYDQAFHTDGKVNVSFLERFSAGGQGDTKNKFDRSKTAFSIIIEVYSEHDSNTIGNLKWDKKYESLINSGDAKRINQVREECGDRFIQTVFNETRLFLEINVSSERRSSLTAFAARSNGKAKIKLFDIAGDVGGDANIVAANQVGALNFRLIGHGIATMPSLVNLGITSDDGLFSLAQKLSDYFKTINSIGQPVKYKLAPLPGIPQNDLNDDRIIRLLTELKENYRRIDNRISNIDALLNNDPRDIILKQPQADSSLRDQKRKLNDFLINLSKAHEVCRQSSEISTCTQKANGFSVAPPIEHVELPPISPPSVSPFYEFFLDGFPIAQGQTMLILQAESLYDGARIIKPAVKNIDVLAWFDSMYIADVNLVSLSPAPDGSFPQNVGTNRLPLNATQWPVYFPSKIVPFMRPMLRIIHADETTKCPFSLSNNMRVITDDNCYTPAGKLIKQIALKNLGHHVLATADGVSKTYEFPQTALVNDCFNNFSLTPLAMTRINVNMINAGQIASRVEVTLPMPGLPGTFLPILNHIESMDKVSWQNFISSQILTTGNPQSQINLCSPRFP